MGCFSRLVLVLRWGRVVSAGLIQTVVTFYSPLSQAGPQRYPGPFNRKSVMLINTS